MYTKLITQLCMYKRRYAINRIKHTIVRPVYCSSNKIGRSYNYLESYDVVTSQVVLHTTHPTKPGRTFLNQVGTSPRISTKRQIYYQIHKMNFQFWAILGSQGRKGKFCHSILQLRAFFLCFNGQNKYFFWTFYTLQHPH